MINKCFAFFFLLLVTLFCCQAKELTPQKIKESFAKINKHLEKNVASDNPGENMAAVQKLMREKMTSGCKILGGKSLCETLQMLVEFAAVPDNKFTCDRERRCDLLLEVNSGQADKYSDIKDGNYPLTRLDKIIEHYSFQDIVRCEYNLPWPIMTYGHKTKAFGDIDRLLKKNLPWAEDVESNMAKAEEILSGLKPQNGAIADALRLLLKLKYTLNEESCNDYGYEILLRNDLATRLGGHTNLERPYSRTAKIYQHYAMKHEELCRSVVPVALRSELKHLELRFYKKVLGLVSAKYLATEKYPKLLDEIDKEAEEERNFYTPLMVEYVKDRLATYEDHVYTDLGEGWLTPREILQYIQDAGARGPWQNTDIINLFNEPYPEGKKFVDDDKLMNLLRMYLFDPCRAFLSQFRLLIPADKFSVLMNYRHLKSRKSVFMKDLTYLMVHAGYDVCTYVSNNMQTIFRTVKAQANSEQ